jgi:Baculovirus F protein
LNNQLFEVLTMNSKECCFILLLLGIKVSAAASPVKLQYASVDDSSGLLFERLYAMRHVTTDRFVFIQQIDYLDMLQDLQNMHIMIKNHEGDMIDCGHAGYQQYLDFITYKIETFNKYLSALQSLDTTYVRYAWDSMITNNEVIDINGSDYESDEPFDAKRNVFSNPEWGNLNAKTAKLLLSSRNDFVQRYAVKNTSTSNFSLKSKPYKTSCEYINNIIVMYTQVIPNVTDILSDLQALLISIRQNKLKNNIFSEDFVFQEMKRLRGTLKKYGRAWVTDNKTDSKNGHFNLAESYRLHVYVRNYSVTLYVLMPLLNENSITYNIYKVMTVPFCRGKSCLFMIPTNEYIAVSESKNYYVPLQDDYKETCSLFAGYDEYLCPEIENVPTLNSNICEIEMFMGRYSHVMTMCDLRLGGTLANNKYYIILLVDFHKWMYVFVKTLNVSYFCNALDIAHGIITVPAGVGILSAQHGDVCSIRLDGKDTISSDTRFYVTESTTYWPKKIFNYNDYFNQYVLGNASLKNLKKLSTFNRSSLLTLNRNFKVNDLQEVNSYFVPIYSNSNEVVNINDDDKPQPDSSKLVYLIIGILSIILLLSASILWYWCCCLKKKSHRVIDNFAVKYTNFPKKIQNDKKYLMIQKPDDGRGDLRYITIKKDVLKTDLENELTLYPLKSRVIK